MGALVFLAFWLPGLVVGLALRLRGWTLAAGAPALTFGTVAVGTLVLGNLHIRWGLLSLSLWTLLVAVVFGAARWFVARRNTGEEPVETPKRSLGEHLMVLAGVLGGAALGVVTFIRGIGYRLDTINQDWDAPYHANAIRWISEHGNSLPSSLAPTANLPEGTPYFYPNTYHSLLAPLLDWAAPMPQLLNLAVLAVIVAWPLGIAALALAWRMPPIAAGVAAAVSTWFTSFPYDSLWRGPLWPYVAGVALIPAALTLARKVLTTRGLAGPLGLGLALAGLAGLHTSLAFVVFVYAVVLLVALAFKLEPIDWRTTWKRLVVTVGVALLIVVPVVLPALVQSVGVTAAQWPEFAKPAEGLGQVLLFSPAADYPQYVLGLAAIIGIALMIRHRRLLWIVGAWAVLGAVYAACASLNNAFINTITGPFYNDAWRFAALLPLAGALAVGELGWTVVTKVTDKLGARTGRAPAFAVSMAIALIGVALLGVATKGGYVFRNSDRLAQNNKEGLTVTRGERDAYQWLAAHAQGQRVMNDRSDGSVWMYGLAGVRPVEWTFYGAAEQTPANLLTWHLEDVEKNPAVRKAINELGVRYVLVGRGLVREGAIRAPGLADLDKFPNVVKKAYENPDAIVYEFLQPGDGKS